MSKSKNILYLHARRVTPERAGKTRLRLESVGIKKSASIVELDSARTGHRFSGLSREQILNKRLGDATRERDLLLFSIETSREPESLSHGLQSALDDLARLIARTQKALVDEFNK